MTGTRTVVVPDEAYAEGVLAGYDLTLKTASYAERDLAAKVGRLSDTLHRVQRAYERLTTPRGAPLTTRQRDLVRFLVAYHRAHTVAPSFAEIADALGLNSLSTVHEHLQTLEGKGYITRTSHAARGIELLPPAFEVFR